MPCLLCEGPVLPPARICDKHGRLLRLPSLEDRPPWLRYSLAMRWWAVRLHEDPGAVLLAQMALMYEDYVRECWAIGEHPAPLAALMTRVARPTL